MQIKPAPFSFKSQEKLKYKNGWQRNDHVQVLWEEEPFEIEMEFEEDEGAKQ